MAIEPKEPKVQTQSSATQRRYRTLAVVKQEAITRVEKPLEDSVFVWLARVSNAKKELGGQKR
jgi:menaquinol-cytochrome c reductase cytochrome b/c subunit